MNRLRPLLVIAATLSLWVGGASTASAAGSGNATCSGSLTTGPGIISSGTYDSLTVQGFCLIPGGAVTVTHSLVVAPGGALLANFPGGPGHPEGDATVTVNGNVMVGPGGSLVLGCAPSVGCANTTNDVVSGNLIEDQPLGVLVHGDKILGNVIESGGGGGVTCTPTGLFAFIGAPVFSTYEDSTIGGDLVISGYNSCWQGVARTTIGGNLIEVNNTLADPDAIEIIANTISGNLVCQQNSMVWDSADLSPTGALFPRLPEPNTVGHQRVGQCVLASPTTPGGSPGPGPF